MVLSRKSSDIPPTEIAGITFPNRIRASLSALQRSDARPATPTVRRDDSSDLKAKVTQHLETFADSLREDLLIEIDEQTVIVSGVVDSDDDRQLVMKVIGKVRDVRSIRDCMKVTYPRRGVSQASEPEDVWGAILGCWGQQP